MVCRIKKCGCLLFLFQTFSGMVKLRCLEVYAISLFIWLLWIPCWAWYYIEQNIWELSTMNHFEYNNSRNERSMGKIIYIIHFCLRVQWQEERLRWENLNENAWVLQLPGKECQQNTKSFLSGKIICISTSLKTCLSI